MQKKGHYAKMCRSGAIGEIYLKEKGEDSDIAFLGTVNTEPADAPWLIKVKADDNEVLFKGDTGADVTVVPEELYRRGKFSRLENTTKILHGPGKNIATADVLSRVPENGQGEKQPEEEINLYKNTVLSSLPATEKRLLEIQKHQENDAVLREVRKYCLEGWPNKFLIDGTVQQYYPFSEPPSFYTVVDETVDIHRTEQRLSLWSPVGFGANSQDNIPEGQTLQSPDTLNCL
ncbi:hypothetical protein NFI96_016486 [Prochilodus magdalenae]|nr:hypothetical protein NFI96_016486 [Prochilodus magdalenae]